MAKDKNNFIIILASIAVILVIIVGYFLYIGRLQTGLLLSDKVEDIERDLKGLEFSDLDQDLQNIEKEL